MKFRMTNKAYEIQPKTVCFDPKLSLDAKAAFFMVMLMLTQRTEYTAAELYKRTSDSSSMVNCAIKELAEYGYAEILGQEGDI